MARKTRTGAEGMIERKRGLEREMEELRATLPELREAAREEADNAKASA